MSVKGSTYLYYVAQGDTINCQLRSTKALVQHIAKGTGAISPDFSTYSPCIYPVLRSTLLDARIQPSVSNFTWKYNGSTISFGSNGLSLALGSLAAGTFKSEVKTIDDDFQVPTLTLLKNLASSSNVDTDVIAFTGKANTGFEATVSADIEVQIEQTDGEAYVGYIEVNNGGVIDDNTSQLTLSAKLLVGGVLQQSGVTYEWKKLVNAVWTALPNTSQSMTVGKNDIVNRELYKVTLTYKSKTAEAVMEVSDETDILIIYPNPTDGAGNSVEEVISRSQTSVTYVPSVCRRGTNTAIPGYSFSYSASSSSGVVIASANNAASFLVNKSHCETAKGGLLVIISATK